MANPAAGDYYIVPVNATGMALDVNGNNKSNGANVQIWTRHAGDAQVFRISFRTNGTAQITSRYTGKSLDLPGGNIASGANIQMWTDNDGRNQEWGFTEKSTASIGGVTYKTYEIHVATATTLCIDVNGGGTSAGSNVQVWTRNDGNNQRWALIPVPPFRSGGVYEIRSMLKTSMAVDIAGGSTANGANCLLYSSHGGNNQKFVLVNEGNGWSLRNVASGKYVDVYGGSFANGTNVQSWVDNDGRNQRWAITAYGTTTINGTTCQIVSLGAGNAGSYMMDAEAALTTNNTNIIIWSNNGGDNQRWALYPTWAVDSHMPAPHTLGFGSTLTSNPGTAYGPLASSQEINTRFYPMWSCADAWATSGPNSYQWRYRYRYMRSSNSSWEDWGAWSSWLTALVTRNGQKSAVTQGLPVSFSLASHKVCQIQFEVRACGIGDLALLYGATSSVTGTFYYRQNVTIGSSAWSPEGLRVACSTDYPYGTTNLYIKSVKWGGKERLTGEVAVKQLDDSTSFLIPQASLNAIPQNGASVTLVFDYGTDQYARFGGATQTGMTTVSMDTTTAEIVTFTEGPGMTLDATVNNIGTTRMWIVTDGQATELARVAVSGNDWTFRVPYPFNKDYEIVTAGTSSDGSAFYVDRVSRKEKKSAHAWALSDGTAVSIEAREGEPLTTDLSIDSVYEANVLNARPWEAVSFGETRKGQFTVKGATAKGHTTSSFEDIEALVGKHAVYRSPAGDICDVAIVSCSRVAHKQWAEVTVTMVREAM